MQVVPYIVMQVIGAIIAAAVLYGIASGQAGWQPGGFASNGFGDLSPGKYSMMAVLLCEVVMTAMFLFVIMGATDSRAPAGFAPIAIGLCLTVIHLVSIPGVQHLGEPCAIDRRGAVRADWRAQPAVAVLAGAAHRRGDRRGGLQGGCGHAPARLMRQRPVRAPVGCALAMVNQKGRQRPLYLRWQLLKSESTAR